MFVINTDRKFISHLRQPHRRPHSHTGYNRRHHKQNDITANLTKSKNNSFVHIDEGKLTSNRITLDEKPLLLERMTKGR